MNTCYILYFSSALGFPHQNSPLSSLSEYLFLIFNTQHSGISLHLILPAAMGFPSSSLSIKSDQQNLFFYSFFILSWDMSGPSQAAHQGQQYFHFFKIACIFWLLLTLHSPSIKVAPYNFLIIFLSKSFILLPSAAKIYQVLCPISNYRSNKSFIQSLILVFLGNSCDLNNFKLVYLQPIH